MANIQNVDYTQIPKIASQMRSEGEELNTQLTNAYQELQAMHDSWYGKRYNELVKSFNQIIPQINQLLAIVVTSLPDTLETIANNYSIADSGNTICSVANESPKNLTDAPTPGDVGMKFVTDQVEAKRAEISKDFQNAVDKMNEISSTYSTVDWNSEAASAFKEKFEQLKNQIIESFNSIDSQFKELMTQTQEDIENAEKNNTVS